MIRLVSKRLIVPQGDTGSFAIPSLIGDTPNSIAVFSIFNEHERIFTKEYPIEDGMIRIELTHEDTKDLLVGMYKWDIKVYVNPRYDGALLIDGDEVDSYYAGFQLPDCEITLAPYHGG